MSTQASSVTAAVCAVLKRSQVQLDNWLYCHALFVEMLKIRLRLQETTKKPGQDYFVSVIVFLYMEINKSTIETMLVPLPYFEHGILPIHNQCRY
jgi:hypothetical protein